MLRSLWLQSRNFVLLNNKIIGYRNIYNFYTTVVFSIKIAFYTEKK